jgi:hypothetical protein
MRAASLRMRHWRKKNRNRDLQNQRNWRKNNLEKSRRKNREWYKRNRKSEAARNKEYIEKNRTKINTRVRLKRHGMSVEEHKALEKEQQGRCAICRKKFDSTPHIDHNHACCPKLRSCDKCRRGLLCEDCNLGIGRFKDSIPLLSNAIQYLEKYQ